MWNTVGHDRETGLFARSLEAGRLFHAYLLSGPLGIGKMTLALDLARAVNCTGDALPCGECGQCQRIARGIHTDVRIVSRDSDENGDRRLVISIDQIRGVQREAKLKPYESLFRVFIFDGVEDLSEEASNCLLKTLEEPPDQVLLILLASGKGGLPPTLISRCQVVDLRPTPLTIISQILLERFEITQEVADEIARLSRGRMGWAIDVASSPKKLHSIREKFDAIEEIVKSGIESRFSYATELADILGRDRDVGMSELDLWLVWWRDVLLVKGGGEEFITLLSRTRSLRFVAGSLSSSQVVGAVNDIRDIVNRAQVNVNLRLVLERMMLLLPRI